MSKVILIGVFICARTAVISTAKTGQLCGMSTILDFYKRA